MLKTCAQGHEFEKTSDCPICPVCEKLKKPKTGFLSVLGAPARRALENAGIKTVSELSKFTEKEILELHGIGPSSIPKLKKELKKEKLAFTKICSRGHRFNESGACPKCWPGKTK